MAIIYSYPTAIPTLTDLLLGTDVDKSGKPTKNFTIQSVVDLIQGTAAGLGATLKMQGLLIQTVHLEQTNQLLTLLI
jgi:hypothetical protein